MNNTVAVAATVLSTVAALLKDAHGFKTKQMLAQWLSQNVEKSAESYWGNSVVASISASMALQGLEPYATWKKLPGDSLIKPFNQSQAIQVIVVGGKTQSTWFVTDFRLGRGILIKKGQIVRKVKESELADVLVEEVQQLASQNAED